SESRCDALTDMSPGCSNPSSGHCWLCSSFPLSSSTATTVGCTISPPAPSSSAADRQLLEFGPCRVGTGSAHLLRSQRTFPPSAAGRPATITHRQRHACALHCGVLSLTVSPVFWCQRPCPAATDRVQRPTAVPSRQRPC